MESMSSWKMVKNGFWLGIGFIIPLITGCILGTLLVASIFSWWNSEKTMNHSISENTNDQIKIMQFREAKNGKQLLILGTIQNAGETAVGSIQIEAELMDGNNQMVFECSEYISKKLEKGEKENFQVKCGCADQPVPEHKTVNVRVVSSSNY
jgi:hypothetical protein